MKSFSLDIEDTIVLNKATNDLLRAIDNGSVSVLILSELSAAFDSTEHDVLLERLEHTKSYLSDKSPVFTFKWSVLS